MDLTEEQHLEMERIYSRYFFTSCWELATSSLVTEEESDLYYEVMGRPCPVEYREIKDQLDELEDCSLDLTEEEIDSMEDTARELEDALEGLQPREVIQYWLVHRDLARHHGWAEMDIDPPVFQKYGLDIWACTFNGISDDWYLERLVEYICSRRRSTFGG